MLQNESCTRPVMQAVDPTYPLYPVMSILCAVSLLCVLSTRVSLQAWNLGVMALCICLFLENLTTGVNTVVWRDNADVKAYVYCDIGSSFIFFGYSVLSNSQLVSHLQIFTSIVKPACTLVITRRLYRIGSLCSIEFTTSKEVWCQ
jgi:hypothetical protein